MKTMKEVERVEARPVDDGTIDALNRLPKDLALVKMQTDAIMGVALARPRDHAKILKDLQTQLATYRSFAEKALYAKPVGKDPATGQQKYATGLSVRAAEAIRSAMGFNSVNVEARRIDDYTAQIEAIFTDFQGGVFTRVSWPVSRRYTTRNKQVAVWDEDRFNNVVLKAEGSKAMREAVMRTIPPGLRFELEEAVDRALDEFLDDATQKKIVAQFTQYQVTPDMLEARLGKAVTAFTKEDRKLLVGFYTALKTGEATVDEIFADMEPPKAEVPQKLKDKLAAKRPATRELQPSESRSDKSEPKAKPVQAEEPSIEEPSESETAPAAAKPPFSPMDPGTWESVDDARAGCMAIYHSLKPENRTRALSDAEVEFHKDIDRIVDLGRLCRIGAKFLDHYGTS